MLQLIPIVARYQKMKNMIQDWAYLKKYENENSSLPNLEYGQKRIVFMGDSITEFWSEISPEFFVGKPYINRGISGQTSPQMLIRFRADAIALKPKIVVILAGVNDIAENTGPSTLEMITNNIFSMVELAKAHNINVILCSVLPANRLNWKSKIQPAEKIIALNILLKNYADDQQVYFLDYYSEMVDEKKGLKTDLADDGVHPNKTGYQIMAQLLEKAIEKIYIFDNI
jgi:lysophospholipase L1-like esterase